MPPKRKAADSYPAAPSTRTTRSSARTAKTDASEETKPAVKTTKRTAKAIAVSDEETVVEPPKKKTKATTSKTTAAKAKPAKATAANIASDTLHGRSSSSKMKPAEAAPDGSIKVDDEPVKDPKSTVKKAAAPVPDKPYGPAAAVTLFDTYADPDELSTIGAEGFERLCTDADIPLDGAMPLLLAWQLDAKEMGKISRDDWVRGMEALQISSLPVLSLALHDLNTLLIDRHSPTPSVVSSTSSRKKKPAAEPTKASYNRVRYQRHTSDPKKAFTELYTFCFVLAKPEGSRNIEMETATALWSVILAPRYILISDVITYINEAGTYKGVNKDLWNMMLEFCQAVQPDLKDYEADGAWPTLIDDFVAWKRAQEGGSTDQHVDV